MIPQNRITGLDLKRYLSVTTIIFYFIFPYIFFYYRQKYELPTLLLFVSFKALFLYAIFTFVDLFKSRLLKITSLIILFFPYISSVVFIFLFNSFMKTAGVVALFSTDADEAINFSRGLWWVYIGIVASYIAISFLYLKTSFVGGKIMKNKMISLFVLFVVMVSTLTAEVIYSRNTDYNGGDTFHHFKLQYIKQYPVNLYFRLYEKVLIDRQTVEYQKKMSEFAFNVSRKDTVELPHIHIFIIGETQRTDLYVAELNRRVGGYDNFFKDNMTIYPNFYSAANATAYSIPLMFTRATIEEQDLTYKEPGITKLFNEAGYKTFWLSNADLFREVPASFYKKEVDEFHALYKKKRGDDIILDGLKEVLADSAKRKFIVINIRGNHYFDYPDKYDYYKPNLRSENINVVSRKHRDLYMNSYNNMTIYQLSILDSLIGMVDSCNAISSILFSSDHGESVFEPPFYFYGHGSSEVPVEQIHSFAFVWLSNQHKNSFPVKIKMIKEHSGELVSTDYIFYTLADIANISFNDENSRYMLSGASFKPLIEVKVRGDGDPIVVEVDR